MITSFMGRPTEASRQANFKAAIRFQLRNPAVRERINRLRVAKRGDPILEPPQARENPVEGIGWIYLCSRTDAQRQSDPALIQETISHYERALTSHIEFGPGFYAREKIWRRLRIELRRRGVKLHNNHWSKADFYLRLYDRLEKEGTTIGGTATALGESPNTIKKAYAAARQRVFRSSRRPTTAQTTATVQDIERHFERCTVCKRRSRSRLDSGDSAQPCRTYDELVRATYGLDSDGEQHTEQLMENSIAATLHDHVGPSALSAALDQLRELISSGKSLDEISFETGLPIQAIKAALHEK